MSVIGTLVSVQHDRELRFTDPITERLRQPTSGLRITPDASLLVQGLLDLGKWIMDLT